MPNNDQFKINSPKTYEVFHLEEPQTETTKIVSETLSADNPASNRSQDAYFVLSNDQLKN